MLRIRMLRTDQRPKQLGAATPAGNLAFLSTVGALGTDEALDAARKSHEELDVVVAPLTELARAEGRQFKISADVIANTSPLEPAATASALWWLFIIW